MESVGGELKPDVIGSTKQETHPAGETYVTAFPFLYGAYIGKFGMIPASYSLRAVTGAIVDVKDPSALRDAVVELFRVGAIEYELRGQLCTDLKTMPVEDVSAAWPESESPYRIVARLALPAREAFSAERRV